YYTPRRSLLHLRRRRPHPGTLHPPTARPRRPLPVPPPRLNSRFQTRENRREPADRVDRIGVAWHGPAPRQPQQQTQRFRSPRPPLSSHPPHHRRRRRPRRPLPPPQVLRNPPSQRRLPFPRLPEIRIPSRPRRRKTHRQSPRRIRRRLHLLRKSLPTLNPPRR